MLQIGQALQLYPKKRRRYERLLRRAIAPESRADDSIHSKARRFLWTNRQSVSSINCQSQALEPGARKRKISSTRRQTGYQNQRQTANAMTLSARNAALFAKRLLRSGKIQPPALKN